MAIFRYFYTVDCIDGKVDEKKKEKLKFKDVKNFVAVPYKENKYNIRINGKDEEPTQEQKQQAEIIWKVLKPYDTGVNAGRAIIFCLKAEQVPKVLNGSIRKLAMAEPTVGSSGTVFEKFVEIR